MNNEVKIERFTVLELETGRSGRAVVVRVEVRDQSGQVFSGWGESPASSPSSNAQLMKSIQDLCASLIGGSLFLDRSERSLTAVKELLDVEQSNSGANLSRIDQSMNSHTRFALETALLDLIARVNHTSVANLMSSHLGRPMVAPRTRPLARDRTPKKGGYQSWRYVLSGNVHNDLAALDRAIKHDGNSNQWWLEGRGKYTSRQARYLVKKLVTSRRSTYPPLVMLEDPISDHRPRELAQLQQYADRLTQRSQDRVEIVVIARDPISFAENKEGGRSDSGYRGINVKPAQIGGLLGTRELIARAAASNPDIKVILSGLSDSTDIGIQSLHHLAAAIPSVAYVTRRSPVAMAIQQQQGFGLDVSLEEMFSSVTSYVQVPNGSPSRLDSKQVLQYPEEDATKYLAKPAMRSHLVEREALIHGLSTVRYNATSFVAEGGSGDALIFGASARSPASSAPSFTISDKHKGSAQALLERAGVAVPLGRIFSAGDTVGAEAYAKDIGYPIVCKPVSGTGGAGVSVNIENDAELRAGFKRIQESVRYGSEDVLVQEHIDGDVYRIMVSGDSVIAVVRRIAPIVVGDGRRSISELVLEKNALRKSNPRLRKGLIQANRSADYLASQGMSLASIPPAEVTVTLASDAYLNGGGESIDVLDETHPSILREAVRTTQAIPGLNYCGVDILLEDHRLALSEQRAGVCELNSCPELITPQFPLYGSPRFVARELLKLSADRHNVELLSVPRTDLSLLLVIETSAGQNYVDWLVARARSLGLEGWVAPRSEGGGVVMLIAGPAVPASVLVSSASSPSQGHPPALIRARHSTGAPSGPFRELEQVPREMQVAMA